MVSNKTMLDEHLPILFLLKPEAHHPMETISSFPIWQQNGGPSN